MLAKPYGCGRLMSVIIYWLVKPKEHEMLIAATPGPGLLFGLMLIAGIAGAYAARWVHVPRVVGFLLSGIALRTVLYFALSAHEDDINAALDESAIPLGAIRDLALGIILFKIGSVFEKKKLTTVGRSVAKTSLAETAVTFAAVAIGCSIVAAITLPDQYTTVDAIVLGILLAAAAIETAPAATLFILQEYEAKGPITDRLLTIVGFNNIICILTFFALFITLTATGVVTASQSITAKPLTILLALTLGSLVLGTVGGALLVITHSRLPIAESLLVFFAMFIVLGAGESWLMQHVGISYSFLLTTLVIGAIFANVAVDSEKLKSTINTVGTPIYAGFFVLAGFKLHVADLLHMGAFGAVYILCRTVGKYYGVKLGTRFSDHTDDDTASLGTAMLCQAAVAIGIVAFIEQHWKSPLAAHYGAVILGSVVIFELAGPLLLKRHMVNCGEVKAITLLRRGRMTDKQPSIITNTLRAILRLLIPPKSTNTAGSQSLTVEHVMRSNIQLIQAAASFDDVLHFIEKSNYSHFPVAHDDGQFAGMIHMSELRDMIYDPALRGLVNAIDLADTTASVVATDMPLADILPQFAQSNVTILPVVENIDSPHIVGLIEERDVLRALHTTPNTGNI